MQKITKLARNIPPGTLIKREIEARGWTQRKFAEVLGRPVSWVSDLLSGKRGITPETAIQLEAALEVSAETWMRHEAAYRLRLAQDAGAVDRKAIEKRRAFCA